MFILPVLTYGPVIMTLTNITMSKTSDRAKDNRTENGLTMREKKEMNGYLRR